MLMGVGSCTGDIECTNCDLRLKKICYYIKYKLCKKKIYSVYSHANIS